MAGADHRGRHTELDRFAAAFPQVTRRAGRRPRAAVRRRRSSTSASRTRSSSTSPAAGTASAASSHELCRVAQRVFVTTPNRCFPLEPHTLLPFAHWLPRAPRDRLLRARGFDDVLDPLGPSELASLFPYPVRIVEPRHDARRRRPRMSLRSGPSGRCTSSSSGSRCTTSSWRALARPACAARALDRRLGVEGRAAARRARARRLARGAACRSTGSPADWLALAFGAFVVLYGAAAAVAGSAAARRTRACSTRRGTTCCRSRPTSSGAAST